ncbi:MAG: hypothetical protein AB7K71_03355 [Polyangiaceae bacterium]
MERRKPVTGPKSFYDAIAQPRLRAIVEASGTETVVIADELQRSLELERGDLVERLKELDAAGAGRFVAGRRGHPSRFEWQLLPAVRQAALDGSEPEEAKNEAPQAGVPSSPQKPPLFIVHQLHLRPNAVAELKLPTDFSTADAERLCALIRLLPFEG